MRGAVGRGRGIEDLAESPTGEDDRGEGAGCDVWLLHYAPRTR